MQFSHHTRSQPCTRTLEFTRTDVAYNTFDRINAAAQTLLDKANRRLHEVCVRARVCAYARVCVCTSARVCACAPGVMQTNSSPSFQDLFHEHAQDPTKGVGGIKRYGPQSYDPNWEQIW